MKKKILIERFQELAGIKSLYEQENDPSNDVKSEASLANKLLAISKGLRNKDYQGLQLGEITKIAELIDNIFEAAKVGNLSPILQKFNVVVGKEIDTSEPKGDIPPEELI